MANPEHLEILKHGFEVWNEWRIKHPEIIPDLDGADLADANLGRTDLRSANLTGARLSFAKFDGANLTGADLSGALVTWAHFIAANLSIAHLSDANLARADFSFARLGGADLNSADIQLATFSGADLSGTDFTNARLGYTTFADNDLSKVKGLLTVKHITPSYIDIGAIYNSRGNIPEVFLRGCGVPENFITYMRSLTGQALEFYKCFISFTEADDLFSERLYNDLQGAGVRCWRWKEDAKWGKTLMRSIDEAVRYYDKLIIICSEQSLNSPAVIREIERALQKEDELTRENKEAEVLFPIRLDEYIFTGWNHYRKADVIAKNVGDFRHWNEPEKYKKAFDRLLRDLKAEEK